MLTLDSESPKISYVGLALNKDYYISWILQMKTVLHHCLSGLDSLKPERVSDHKSILLRLHTLVSFTSPGTWAIQKVKGMDQLKTGMNQLCANIMGHLVNNRFYATMQVVIRTDSPTAQFFSPATMLIALLISDFVDEGTG